MPMRKESAHPGMGFPFNGSQEQGLTCRVRLNREGTWLFNGSAVTNENICRYLFRHLDKNSEGTYVLATRDQEFPVEIEDTPYLVCRCSLDGSAAAEIRVTLNDGTSEDVPVGEVWLAGERQLYCTVKDGRHVARFNRTSQYSLGRILSFDSEACRFFLEHQGRRTYLGLECRSSSEKSEEQR